MFFDFWLVVCVCRCACLCKYVLDFKNIQQRKLIWFDWQLLLWLQWATHTNFTSFSHLCLFYAHTRMHMHTHASRRTQRTLHGVFLLEFWQTTTLTFKGGETAWLWSQGMETEPEWNVNRPCGLSSDAKLQEEGKWVCSVSDFVWNCVCLWSRHVFCVCIVSLYVSVCKSISVHVFGRRVQRSMMALYEIPFCISVDEITKRNYWT